MENRDRGPHYIPIDIATAKLYVFVDGSFANNKDLSSQIGFVIMLSNEVITNPAPSFNIQGNLIHWSSTKCKRVTRSVLASEICAMAAGADMGLAIGSTLDTTTNQLGLPHIPIIICTDSCAADWSIEGASPLPAFSLRAFRKIVCTVCFEQTTCQKGWNTRTNSGKSLDEHTLPPGTFRSSIDVPERIQPKTKTPPVRPAHARRRAPQPLRTVRSKDYAREQENGAELGFEEGAADM